MFTNNVLMLIVPHQRMHEGKIYERCSDSAETFAVTVE